jgi:hypothetical protein
VRPAEDLDRSPVREDEAQNALDRGRLSGPVRPEVAEDFALFDGERDPLQDLLFLWDEARAERLVEDSRF